MAQMAQIFSFFDKRRGESHTDYIDLSCVAREIDFIFSQITQIAQIMNLSKEIFYCQALYNEQLRIASSGCFAAKKGIKILFLAEDGKIKRFPKSLYASSVLPNRIYNFLYP